MAEADRAPTRELPLQEPDLLDISSSNDISTSAEQLPSVEEPQVLMDIASAQPSNAVPAKITTLIDARLAAQRLIKQTKVLPSPRTVQPEAAPTSLPPQDYDARGQDTKGIIEDEDEEVPDLPETIVKPEPTTDTETSPTLHDKTAALRNRNDSLEPETPFEMAANISPSQDADVDMEDNMSEFDLTPPSHSRHRSPFDSPDDLSDSSISSSDPYSPASRARLLRRSIGVLSRDPLTSGSGSENVKFFKRLFGFESPDVEADDGLDNDGREHGSSFLEDDEDDDDLQDPATLSRKRREAFLVVRAAYEELVKAGKAIYKDQLQWNIMLQDHIRDFNKCVQDKSVGKDEMKTARKAAECRKDERQITTEEHELRQRLLKAEMEAGKKAKKRGTVEDNGDPSLKVPKRAKKCASTFRSADWYAKDGIEIRGVVEAEWNPERRSSPSPADDDMLDGRSIHARNNRAPGSGNDQSVDDSDSDCSLSEPEFQCEANSRVLTKILTQVMEKGPKAREKAKDDRKLISDSKQYFRHRNRPTMVKGENRFKMPRMKSKLLPHQVAGTAWIRFKELSGDEPKGGVFADAMGLGKTVQMLAAIMDGKPDKAAMRDGQGSTLVVCSASLVDQWEAEVRKHCDPKWLGRVTRFKAADFARSTNDPLGFLQSHDIIITTYDEVTKSYPDRAYPDELVTEQEKQAWWDLYLESNKGLLHRIHFHRFVVDECHHVKNDQSKRYAAVRALKATYRWLMSGTPVVDSVEELYSYFKITHDQFEGSKQTFRLNYLNPENEDHQQRLNYRLHAFMYRRTHDDTFFGQCLVPLPPAKETRIECSQSPVEKAIYRIVVTHWVKLIEESSDKKKTFEYISNMMTELQQLNSSPLLVQKAFERMSEDQLAEVMALYKNEAQGNFRDRFRFLQALYGFSKESGCGAGYGRYPEFTPYKAALKASQEPSTPIEFCYSCKLSPASTELVPCCHVLCSACAADVEADIEDGGGECDCGQRVGAINRNTRPRPTSNVVTAQTATQSQKAGNRKARGKKKPANAAEDCAASWLDLDGRLMPSTKLDLTKLIVLDRRAKEPGCKIIIFTHYLGVIYALKRLCVMESWAFVEFTGSLKSEKRTSKLKEFEDCDGPCILLATIKTGSTGLNLVTATKVIIMEPWWNESVDKQAFARVWRIGQDKPTECIRLYMRGTIDDRKLQIANGKSKRIMRLAMKGQLNGITVKELVRLFKVAETNEEKDAGGFILDNNRLVPISERKRGEDFSDSSSDDEFDSSDYDDSEDEDDDFEAPRSKQNARRRY